MTNDLRDRATIEFSGGTIRLLERAYDWRDPRGYNAAPRMYVDIADETLWDDLVNRTRRPYSVYKTMIHMSDLDEVLDLSRLSWSQKAGCSMCPCSPGFILNRQYIVVGDKTFHNFDAWLTLEGSPAVRDDVPARDIAILV